MLIRFDVRDKLSSDAIYLTLYSVAIVLMPEVHDEITHHKLTTNGVSPSSAIICIWVRRSGVLESCVRSHRRRGAHCPQHCTQPWLRWRRLLAMVRLNHQNAFAINTYPVFVPYSCATCRKRRHQDSAHGCFQDKRSVENDTEETRLFCNSPIPRCNLILRPHEERIETSEQGFLRPLWFFSWLLATI